MKKVFKHIELMAVIALLVSCVNLSNKILMDKETREHAATKKFLAFSANAKTSTYDELAENYYKPSTQKRIISLKGWYKLAYSSAYHFLKEGHCESLALKQISTNRVQVDCIGKLHVKSLLLPERLEEAHLRVNMIKQDNQWFFDKAGYIHTNSHIQPVTYGRFGIKFKSTIEKPGS